ncbi:hypothetical protein RIR_jg21944.t1 [Rhizophagus irregularis DAOM 181602=DAOM 197198]|nr:hypothetical protein RIR_jg21944.t1 [Rhizophagus irregularis DAOM 181602=DAOM 197198]
MKKGRFFNLIFKTATIQMSGKDNKHDLNAKCRQVFHKSDLTADASLEDKLLASKKKRFPISTITQISESRLCI